MLVGSSDQILTYVHHTPSFCNKSYTNGIFELQMSTLGFKIHFTLIQPWARHNDVRLTVWQKLQGHSITNTCAVKHTQSCINYKSRLHSTERYFATVYEWQQCINNKAVKSNTGHTTQQTWADALRNILGKPNWSKLMYALLSTLLQSPAFAWTISLSQPLGAFATCSQSL